MARRRAAPASRQDPSPAPYTACTQRGWGIEGGQSAFEGTFLAIDGLKCTTMDFAFLIRVANRRWYRNILFPSPLHVSADLRMDAVSVWCSGSGREGGRDGGGALEALRAWWAADRRVMDVLLIAWNSPLIVCSTTTRGGGGMGRGLYWGPRVSRPKKGVGKGLGS